MLCTSTASKYWSQWYPQMYFFHTLVLILKLLGHSLYAVAAPVIILCPRLLAFRSHKWYSMSQRFAFREPINLTQDALYCKFINVRGD